MNIKSLSIWSLLLLLPFFRCSSSEESEKIIGSGTVKSEFRALDTGAINTIELNGAFNVGFSTRRSGLGLYVTAEDNLLPYIETKQSNGVITIDKKEGYTLRNSKDINIDIKALSLKDLIINGTGTFIVDTIQGVNPTIRINGSGNLTVSNFRCDSYTAVLDGNGIMFLNGSCPILTTTINGSGQADVFATKKIYATINGSGVIRYKGTSDITKSINGSGAVTKQ